MTTPPYPDDMSTCGLRISTPFTYRDESGEGMRVWCRYCDRYHVPGRYLDEPIRSSNGHRVAHCYIDDPPYRLTGYVLVELDYPVPEPARRYPPKHTRHGDLVSGFLLAQRRALKARR